MKAIAYTKSLPISDTNALVDIELPRPVAAGQDLLVKVKAISVNPVDTKVRKKAQPAEGEHKVLGWDVAGTVEAVGDAVTLFQPGDRVWYAGAINRPGCNSEYHLVDERLVAKMPTSLEFADAAAMPLTSITAWEILFDRFRFNIDSTGTLLVVGAAGGVGSMMVQLAKTLTGLTVIATASREETINWVRQLGADHVINHRKPLSDELKAIGFDNVNFVASLTNTSTHLPVYPDIIAPQGGIALIDDPDSFDILPFKRKSISFYWEFMFTRSIFKTDDMPEQHRLLTEVATLVDVGKLKTTRLHDYGKINAANLIKAHAFIESGKSMGKVVLSGF